MINYSQWLYDKLQSMTILWCTDDPVVELEDSREIFVKLWPLSDSTAVEATGSTSYPAAAAAAAAAAVL